jgi:hypothetical protein
MYYPKIIIFFIFALLFLETNSNSNQLLSLSLNSSTPSSSSSSCINLTRHFSSLNFDSIKGSTFYTLESIGKRLGEQALKVLEELPEIIYDLENLLKDLKTRLSFEIAIERHEAIRRGTIMRSPIPTAVPRVFENIKGEIKQEIFEESLTIEEMILKKNEQDLSSSSTNKLKDKKRHGIPLSSLQSTSSKSSSTSTSNSSSQLQFQSTTTPFDFFKARVTVSILKAKAIHSMKLVNVGVKEDYEGRIVQTFSPTLDEFLHSSIGTSSSSLSLSVEDDLKTQKQSQTSTTKSPSSPSSPFSPSSPSLIRRKRVSVSSDRIRNGIMSVLKDIETLSRFSLVYPTQYEALNKRFHLSEALSHTNKAFINEKMGKKDSSKIFTENKELNRKKEEEGEEEEEENNNNGEFDIIGVASWTPPWLGMTINSQTPTSKESADDESSSSLSSSSSWGGGDGKGIQKRRNGDIVFDPIALEKHYGLDGRGGNIGGLGWRQNQGLIRPIVNARTRKEALIISLVRILQLTGLAVCPFRILFWQIPKMLFLSPLYYFSKIILYPIIRSIYLSIPNKILYPFSWLYTRYIQPIQDFIEGQIHKLNIDWALWIIWNTSDQLYEILFPFIDPEYIRPEVSALKCAIQEIKTRINDLNDLFLDSQSILYTSLNISTLSWSKVEFITKTDISSINEIDIDKFNAIQVSISENRQYTSSWATIAGLPNSYCPSIEVNDGHEIFNITSSLSSSSSSFVDNSNSTTSHLIICPFKYISFDGVVLGTWSGKYEPLYKAKRQVYSLFDNISTHIETCTVSFNSSLINKKDEINKNEKKTQDTGKSARFVKQDVSFSTNTDNEEESEILSTGETSSISYSTSKKKKEKLINISSTTLTSILEKLSFLPEAMIFYGNKCNEITGIQQNEGKSIWKVFKQSLFSFYKFFSRREDDDKKNDDHHFKARLFFQCNTFQHHNDYENNILDKDNEGKNRSIYDMKIVSVQRIGKCTLDMTIQSVFGCRE